MKFIRGDIRQGSGAFFSMTNGQGNTIYGKTEYRKIVTPSELIYTQQFCDADGNTVRNPMNPNWPETIRTTVKVSVEDENFTRITVTTEPCGTVTPDQMKAFVDARTGMTVGWTGSFDKLEELLG
jgi:uncharacterized protein YndB with AHSA1/START domain